MHEEGASDKIQQPFMIKMLNKPGIEGDFLNLMKSICKKPTASMTLNGEIWDDFPLRSETRPDTLATST